jgi:hypothetical protein
MQVELIMEKMPNLLTSKPSEASLQLLLQA